MIRSSQSMARFILRGLVDFGEDVAFVDEANSTTKFILEPPGTLKTLKIALSPSYWVAESYARGDWKLQKGDLAEFLLYMTEQVSKKYLPIFIFLSRRRSFTYLLKQYLFTHYFSRQVRSHYEIDTSIYECMLDDELVYTCAFFTEDDWCLEEAQTEKYRTTIQRLSLNASSPKLLNIGCGWGSFERYLTDQITDARVVGLSISKSQLDYAEKASGQLSLTRHERIQYVLQDYLDHSPSEPYDAVIAIGMVEHVGRSGYEEFFNVAQKLLKSKGTLLVHMIVKAEADVPTNAWIDRHIFPGGYAPSIAEVMKAAESSNLRSTGVYIHGPENYRRTLQCWRRNLVGNLHKLMQLYVDKGLSNTEAACMYRRWEIYLAGSETTFLRATKPLQIAQFRFESSYR